MILRTDRMKLASYDVISFDVFDTVVTRNVYKPADIFLRLQFRLPLNSTLAAISANYRSFRINAELVARKRHCLFEDITIQEIYQSLALAFGLDDESRKKLLENEIEEELRASIPIAENIQLISEMRRLGKRIVFVSDMYLPHEVIERLLMQAGAYCPGDSVYISGEQHKTKYTGTLFDHVVQDLRINPQQMVHIGDCHRSDVFVPRWKYSIGSHHFKAGDRNRYERTWGENCSCLFCSSVAGASRGARLADSAKRNGIERTLFSLGCNVVGPILTSYILWVFQRAKAFGVERLYFLSRDGQVMKEVARELAAKLGINLELRYLHVSRTSVLPALAALDKPWRSLEWLKQDTIPMTPRVVANRLKIDANKLMHAMNKRGISIEVDTPIQRVELDALCNLLINDSEISDEILIGSRLCLQSITDFFEQEGLFDETKWALVDLGWNGSIQDVIYGCLANKGNDKKVIGFYFGLKCTDKATNRKLAFFSDPHVDEYYCQYSDLFSILMEVFCLADHGMVKGYEQDAKGEIRALQYEIEDQINSKYIKVVREGIVNFLKYLDVDIEMYEPLHVRKHVLRILKMIFFTPSSAEALALGEIRFSLDQLGDNIKPLAGPFSFNSALSYLTKSSFHERTTISSWFFASWARSGIIPRLLLVPIVSSFRLLNAMPERHAIQGIKFVRNYNKLIKVIKRKLNTDFRKG